MLSRTFHVNVHPKRTDASPESGPVMFARTFEQVAAALAALPRMFVEPDGSFVWVASHGPEWQIDGVLYDGTGRLWYAELKGRCPQPQFDELLSALGWPNTPVLVRIVEEAAQLDENEFRRYAGWWRQAEGRRQC
jgi:hypothetical protein